MCRRIHIDTKPFNRLQMYTNKLGNPGLERYCNQSLDQHGRLPSKSSELVLWASFLIVFYKCFVVLVPLAVIPELRNVMVCTMHFLCVLVPLMQQGDWLGHA